MRGVDGDERELPEIVRMRREWLIAKFGVLVLKIPYCFEKKVTEIMLNHTHPGDMFNVIRYPPQREISLSRHSSSYT